MTVNDQFQSVKKDAKVRKLEKRSVFEAIQLVVLTSEPSTPIDGMVVYADGTSWNPGSGEGVYAREGGSWVKL